MEQEVGKYWDELIRLFIEFVPMVVGAILILIIGLWAIKQLGRLMKKVMAKREIDPSVSIFLQSLIKWGLKILLFIMVIAKLGVPTTSFVAVMGAAGLAVGMALQGSLGNFAGGVLILLFKPYRVGDYINAQGISGTVQGISIFTTTLRTDGNQLAIIPNGQLSNEKIINYSSLERRAEAMDFTINVQDNLQTAKEALKTVISANPKIINDESTQPKVVVKSIDGGKVTLQLQYFTKTSDFWGTHFEMLETGKIALDKAGMNKFLPQQEVRILGK